MERFTQFNCVVTRHSCSRLTAAPTLSRLFLLLVLFLSIEYTISAQCTYSYNLETATGTPLLGTDAGDFSAGTFVDIDGDGDEDLVSGALDGSIHVWLRELPVTNPIFVEISGPGVNPFDGVDVGDRSTPTFGDIDGDGDEDCVIGNLIGVFRYFRNDGAFGFVELTGAANPFDGFDIGSNSSPVLGDIDNDGDLDCLTGRSTGTIRWIENVGSVDAPDFASPIALGLLITATGNNSMPALSDLDHDGDLDLVVGNSTGRLVYYSNIGGGIYNGGTNIAGLDAAPIFNLVGPVSANNFSAPAFTDMDEDEDEDIAVGVFSGRFRFLRNTSCSTPPTLTGCTTPPNITVSLGADGTFELSLATTGLSAPASACGGGPVQLEMSDLNTSNPPVVGGPLVLDCMDIPSTTVLVSAKDPCNGRRTSCQVSVTVQDPISPVARCVPYLDLELNAAGTASINVNSLDPSSLNDGSLDNCDESLLAYEVSSFPPTTYTCANLGPTGLVLTLNVYDNAGNFGTCTTIVRVVDRIPPTLPTLGAITLDVCQINSGTVDFTTTQYRPAVTDNCSVTATPNPTTPPLSWAIAPLMPRSIVWTYTDAGGNVRTQTQTVQIVNNAPPVVTCPANITVNSTLPGNPCGNVATWATPIQNLTGCNSDINIATLASSHTSGAVFPEGVTLVTYTVQDFSGNAGFCTFTVTIAEPPSISGLPGGITVNADNGQCGAVVTWAAPSISDDCSTPTVVISRASGSFFSIGNTTVTYTATDAKGNSSTASFVVRVNDNQTPVITCPPNLTVNNQPGQCFANVLVSPPASSDNCPNSLVVTRTPSVLPAQFPVGVTSILYSATDGTNTAGCSYSITVRDNEKPVWTGSVCGSTVVLPPPPTTSTACTQAYAWSSPTVTDNCIGTMSNYTVTVTGAGFTTGTLTVSGSSISHGATFREGASTVTYTATDNALTPNTSVCSFTVQVRNTTPPTISSCGSSSSATPVLVDVTPGQCALTFTGSFSPVSGYGTLPITAAEGTDCDPGVLTYVFNSNNVALVSGVTTLPVGEHILRARATDVSSNTSTNTCLVTVRVRETVAPTATVCPPNQVYPASSATNTCGATITNLPQPTWSDNCATGSTLASLSSVAYSPTITNNFFPVGTTTAFFTTRDLAAPWGNLGFCTYTITVNDVTNPTITCPASVVLGNDVDQCSRVYSWLNPTATDNCSLTPLSGASFTPPFSLTVTGYSASTSTSTATFPLGVSRVTYTATDVNGRTNTCSFNVTVNDTQGPNFNGTCPAPQVWNIATCNLTAGTATWTTPTATDNCGGSVTISAPNIASGTALPTGVHTVSYTATDVRSNTSVCSFTITVREVSPPTFSNMPSAGICPPAVVAAGPNCATVITAAMLTAPAATDNCPGTVGVSRVSNLPGTTTNVDNSIVVVWRATDVSGNTSDCSQTVTLRDQTVPVMNCHSSAAAPININASAAQPCLGISPSELFSSNQWIAPTATDNCSGALTPYFVGNAPAYYPLGISQLLYRATDYSSNSNSASCTVYIRVVENDNTAPSISCPNNVTVNTNAGVCYATNVGLGNPNASDTGGCSNSVNVSNNAPSQYPINVTLVTWTATDGGGNTAVCVQSVTVNANTEICGNFIDDDCDGLIDEGCSGGGNNDPCQVQLLAADGAIRDSFGFAGVLKDDVAAIGAPADDNARGVNAGAVYLRYIDFGGAGVWGEFKKIIAGDGATSDMFGASVDLDGDILVVGAPQDDSKGSIYLFGRNVGGGDNWGQIAKIASPGAIGDRFGAAVEIDGNFVVVGAPLRDLTAPARTDAGAAYVYRFNGSAWVFHKELNASDALTSDRFGSAVAISDDNIVVGAPLSDPASITSAGAAYVFRQDQGGANNWGQQKKLVANLDVATDEQFGYSVSISGSNIAIGDYRDSYASTTRPGSVYMFSRNLGGTDNWGTVKRVTPFDLAANDNFGFSVSVDGGDLLVGSRFDDEVGSNRGSAYHYAQNEGGANNWGFIEKILAGDGVLNDNFGQFVSYNNGIYLVGSVRDDIGNSLDQGSAYILTDCASAAKQAGSENRDEPVFENNAVRCFPNPFSDVINVDVNLDVEQNLIVTVTDATGRQVATLFNGLATPENRYQWDAGSFNGGMYFIRVESDSVRKVVPVVLIK
jgi:hypothetical protein